MRPTARWCRSRTPSRARSPRRSTSSPTASRCRSCARCVLPVRFSLLVRPGTARRRRPRRRDPPARRGAVPPLAARAPARRRGRARAVDGRRRARGRRGPLRRRRRRRRSPPSTTGSRRSPRTSRTPRAPSPASCSCAGPGRCPPRPGPTARGCSPSSPTTTRARCSSCSRSSRCAASTSRASSRGPTGGRLGQYFFSLDCDGHLADERVGEALSALRRVCADVRVLGSWARADGVPAAVARGTGDDDFRDAAAWLARLRAGGDVVGRSAYSNEPPPPAAAAVAVLRDDRALARLHDDEALAREGELERLAAAPADERRRRRPCAPGGSAACSIQAIADCRSAKVGASAVPSTTGVPNALMTSRPVPVNTMLKAPPDSAEAPSTRRMSQVSPGSKASTFAPLTVTESPSRSSTCSSLAVLREEDVAAPAAAHERHALAGERLLEEPADAAGALVGERHVALVGDHRALPGEHLAVEPDLEHPRVLQRHRLVAGALEVLAEQVAAHGPDRTAPERPRGTRDSGAVPDYLARATGPAAHALLRGRAGRRRGRCRGGSGRSHHRPGRSTTADLGGRGSATAPASACDVRRGAGCTGRRADAAGVALPGTTRTCRRWPRRPTRSRCARCSTAAASSRGRSSCACAATAPGRRAVVEVRTPAPALFLKVVRPSAVAALRRAAPPAARRPGCRSRAASAASADGRLVLEALRRHVAARPPARGRRPGAGRRDVLELLDLLPAGAVRPAAAGVVDRRRPRTTRR